MHMQNWSIIFKKINKTIMYIQNFDIRDKTLAWNPWKLIVKAMEESYWSIILNKVNETLIYIENFNVNSKTKDTYRSTMNKTDVFANETGFINVNSKTNDTYRSALNKTDVFANGTGFINQGLEMIHSHYIYSAFCIVLMLCFVFYSITVCIKRCYLHR